jgi:hypothetical protein
MKYISLSKGGFGDLKVYGFNVINHLFKVVYITCEVQND